MGVLHDLRAHARIDPDAPAVGAGAVVQSFGELDHRTDLLAHGLARHVRPGDRVVALADPRVEFAELFIACGKLGAIFVPLNSFLKGSFLRHQIADAAPALTVLDRPGYNVLRAAFAGDEGGPIPGRLALLDEVSDGDAGTMAYVELFEHVGAPLGPPAKDGDTAAIIYTSGTTGLPKGCMLPHGLFAATPEVFRAAGWIWPGARLLNSLPFFHGGAYHALASAFAVGSPVFFLTQFSASGFWPLVRELGVTAYWGTGATGMALLAAAERDDDLDNPLEVAGMVPVGVSDAARFTERFGATVLSDCFAQTECTPITISRADRARRPNTAGLATDLVEVAILDEDGTRLLAGKVGEICIRPRRPHAMFSGYWRAPEATLAAWDGLWHHTGDLGYLDDDGYLIFSDRLRDSIRRRGENVSAFEVEAVLRNCLAVDQVAVYGVPSPLGEHDIRVAVVVRDGVELRAGEFFDYCKGNLPYFAIPRFVDLIEELPTNAMGRVQKDVLRNAAATTPATWDFEVLGLTVSRTDRREA